MSAAMYGPGRAYAAEAPVCAVTGHIGPKCSPGRPGKTGLRPGADVYKDTIECRERKEIYSESGKFLRASRNSSECLNCCGVTVASCRIKSAEFV